MPPLHYLIFPFAVVLCCTSVYAELPMPPVTKAMARASKSAPKAMEPVKLLLTWPDKEGGIPWPPPPWNANVTMMPDGGSKFWVVYQSLDLRTWYPLDVVITNQLLTTNYTAQCYFRVHWRGDGEPAWRWPIPSNALITPKVWLTSKSTFRHTFRK